MPKQKHKNQFRFVLPVVYVVTAVFVLVGLLLVTKHVKAATGINEQVNFQGRLLDSTGAVVADGSYNMKFRIYQDGDGVLSGGDETLKWTETRESSNKVLVKNGYFSVYLGSVNSFSSSVDWNQDTLWLSIDIGGTGSPSYDGEMSPFTRLSSTPYSLNSGRLGGLSSSGFVQLAQGLQTDGSSSNPSIYINKTGSTANILQLQKSSSDVFVIANDGALTYTNAGSSDAVINLTSTGDFVVQDNGSAVFTVNDDGTTVFRTQSDSTTAFQIQDSDGGNPVFSVDTDNERIGIGTNSPSNKLTIAGGDLELAADTGQVRQILFSNVGGGYYPSVGGAARITSASGDFYWQAAGGDAMQLAAWHEVILQGGRNSASDLSFITGGNDTYNTRVINSATGTIGLTVEGLSGQTGDLQRWVVNDSVLSVVNSSGYLGIGDATPDAKIDVDGTITGTTSQDLSGVLLTNQTSSGTQRGLIITNADDAANATTESLISLDNAETTASTVTDGLIITSSGVNNGVVDAIDVSDSNITNGINLGSNNLILAGDTINDFSGNGLGVSSNALTINLTSSGTTGSTSSNSGLEVGSAGLTLLKGCADNEILKYTDAGGWACSADTGGGGNSFTTVDTPSGTDPTADTSSDTLQLLASGSNITITGANDPETITFNIDETALAGNGLSASSDALVVNVSNGLEINSDNVRVNQAFDFAFTGNVGFTPSSTGDLTVTLDSDSNLVINGTVTSSSSQDLQAITLTNQTSSGTQRGLVVTNADDAANATTEALAVLNSTETTADKVTDYLLITTSATDTTTDAIDVSDSDLFNAINIGANAIAGTNFNVSGAGALVAVGVNSGSGLLQGSGGLTITGTTSIGATAGNATSIGNTTGTFTLTGSSSSSFILNGLTISAAELNLLDGHGDSSSTLVDTNDGVATAIIGTGALNAGSITSGFTTIDTGTDNITTTGEIQGNTIERSTAGTLAVGTVRSTAITLGGASTVTTAAGGLTVTSGKTFTVGGDAFTDLTGNGLQVSSNTLSLKALTSADALSSNTSNGSGLDVLSGGVGLLQGCSDGQYLGWNEASDVWQCTSVGSVILGYASVTSNQSIPGSTETDVTSLSSTVSVPSGHRVRITTVTNPDANAFGEQTYSVIKESGTQLQVCDQTTVGSSFGVGTIECSVVLSPSSGSHTYKAAVYAGTSGFGSNSASSTNPSYILVEDLDASFSTTLTLQSGYDVGNTLTTTDGRDLSFTLANTTTDANFLINMASGSTGKFAVQAAGTDTFRVGATGDVSFAPSSTSDVTFSLDNDSTLILNGTVTDTGQLQDINLTLGDDSGADTVSALNIDVTSAATSDADILYGLNIGNLSSADATVSETALNIGTGWDEAIRANGIVTLGAQADSTPTRGPSSFALTNSAAGNFGGDTGRDGAYSSTVFNGKIYVATKENDASAIYRYDGGTTWTQVSDGTDGKIVSGDTANIDYSNLATFNGYLYALSYNQLGTACTSSANCSALYRYDGSSWTLVNSARGTFGAQTLVMGGSDIQVCNNHMYVAMIGTAATNTAIIYRYDGGSAFTSITFAAGKFIVTGETAQVDAYNMVCYGGELVAGTVTGSATNTARVAKLTGGDDAVTSTTISWVQLNHATNGSGGTFGAETNEDDVDSMTVFGGELYVGIGEPNLAAIYRYKTGSDRQNVVSTGKDFQRVTSTLGRIDSASDATDIDHIPVLRQYNGRLYAGSDTSAAGNLGGIYEYDPSVAAAAGSWTILNSATGAPGADRGKFGSQTGVDKVDTLLELNGTLYIGTEDSAGNVGSIYSWTKKSTNSFALRFDSGSSNYGSISFVGNLQAGDNNGHMGSFLFSNPVNLGGGAFDYAEDYPTYDNSLVAGHPVAVDPEHTDHVRLARPGDSILGVVSEKPGMRLSTTVPLEGGDQYVPIALVGRVPVKVTTADGSLLIKAGDKLTLSPDKPGFLQKATGAGEVVGTALESYGSAEDGKVSLFVNPGWNGNFAALGDLKNPTVENLTIASNGAGAGLTIKNQAGEDVATFDAVGNATFAGTVTADKIKANQIEGLEILTDKISSLSARLADNTQQIADSPAQPSSSEVLGANTDGTIEISKLGDVRIKSATVALDLTVMGQLTANGGLVVNGDATFNGDVAFNGRATFNSDTAGFAVVKTDQSEVEVKFDKPYDSEPAISLAIKNGQFASYAYELTHADDTDPGSKVTGFKIVLQQQASSDVQFSWTALNIKDAQTSQQP